MHNSPLSNGLQCHYMALGNFRSIVYKMKINYLDIGIFYVLN